MEIFGERAIYDMGLSRDIRVGAVIRDGAWHFPCASSHLLMELFHMLI